jgi:lauroyl/myristoyl acyltransferase
MAAVVNLSQDRALMRLRSSLANADKHIAELFRIFVLQFILMPAAYFLPRSWALAAANVFSLPLIAFPEPGMTAYRNMRRVFGGSPFRSFQLTWEWIANPFRDFVILKRVMYGREDVFSWKIVEENAENVARLRESGQSFIMASAHFKRTAAMAMACPQVTPGNFIQVSIPTPKEVKRPQDLRLRIQYGTTLEAASTVWRRPFEYAYTTIGLSGTRLLFRRLSKPGSVVDIHVDAPWPKNAAGSFSRPFAGMKDRGFATGAAHLAKVCRCPIISCVYWEEDDGTVVLRWGAPILHVDDEIETMNRLIDTFEVAVGERPTQYVLDIGNERRWNPKLRSWEDLPLDLRGRKLEPIVQSAL